METASKPWASAHSAAARASSKSPVGRKRLNLTACIGCTTMRERRPSAPAEDRIALLQEGGDPFPDVRRADEPLHGRELVRQYLVEPRAERAVDGLLDHGERQRRVLRHPLREGRHVIVELG